VVLFVMVGIFGGSGGDTDVEASAGPTTAETTATAFITNDPCVPPFPPDLDYDIGHSVAVVGPSDPHRLDREGDGGWSRLPDRGSGHGALGV
jgi:hypothetical protein